MLHYGLASQEGFSIKMVTQVFRTCLTIKKTSLRNATKLKSESKCGETFTNFPFLKFGDLFGKKEHRNRMFPFYFYFSHFTKIFRGKQKQ
jgi:hypothetical protein